MVSELQDWIRTEDDMALFRVNPIRYARTRSVDESESIDLFLHATRAGLFEMEWNIVCGSCGNVFKSFRNLEKVDPHFHCNLCDMENSANLDDLIHVMFTISPRIKDIILHHPDQLTLEQLVFDYQYSQDSKAQYDGFTVPELLRQFTQALQYLEPGEETSLDVDLTEGALVVRDTRLSASVVFLVGLNEPTEERSFQLTLDETGFSHPNLPLTELTLDTPVGTHVFPKVHLLGPGRVKLRCRNTSDERLPFWAVRYPPLFSGSLQMIEFEPFLSAKRLLSTDTFRRLFRAEAPHEGEGLSVNDLTYLFTDLKNSTALYDEIGDASAYNLIRLHFDALGQAVTDNHGVIVKTVGDAVMATFVQPVDAVSAATAMLGSLEAVNASMSTALELKIGIHRGHSIAVRLNERLDYFGQNVNIAARTQQLAGASEILVTQAVLDASGVGELLADASVEPVRGVMRGVAEEIPVFKVSGS